MVDANPYRLPRTFSPERYELTLTPDLAAATFTGEERVRVAVARAHRRVVLNAAELEILSAELIGERRQPDRRAPSTLDEEAERGHPRSRGDCQPGPLDAAPHLHRHPQRQAARLLPQHLHRRRRRRAASSPPPSSRPPTPAGPSRAGTSPTSRPSSRVTLVVDDELAAVSNAAEVAKQRRSATASDRSRFADTMMMSTYLVAFVVGPLEATEPVDVDGTPLRVACVPGKGHLAGFALEVGAFCAALLHRLLRHPLPGRQARPRRRPRLRVRRHGEPRLRHLPRDRAARRPERRHAGRAAARGRRDRPRARPHVVRRPRDHEVVERHLAQRGLRHVHGDDVRRRLPARVGALGRLRPRAHRRRSTPTRLQSTRPIEFEVVSPDDAEGMFDVLTYEKGAAVLRMLEQYLGADEFRDGIRAYLDKHAYGNTETTDLWDALEAASAAGAPVMDSWIFQGGYPLVHVEPAEDGTSLVLSQSRFIYLDESGDNTQRWQIPVGIRALINGEQHHQTVLFTDDSVTVTLPGKPEWLIVNEHAHGFFRTSYESGLLRQLIQNVESLEPLEQFTLATDTWAACLSGAAESTT